MTSALLLMLLAAGTPKRPQLEFSHPQPQKTGIPVGKVWVFGDSVEQMPPGEDWRGVKDAFRLRTGDRLRTGADSVVRIEFPWMSLTAGPSSQVAIPGGLVLATLLESGRAELSAGKGDIVKVRTAEAQVRGAGRVVLRREGDSTYVMAMHGRFRVEGTGGSATLGGGQGTIVRPKQAPGPVLPLAAPPARLEPGADPPYVARGQPLELNWSPGGAPHHLQVLSVDSEEILLERDVEGSPESVAIPWVGTFRWRVSVRDGRGLEGMPSRFGFFCVVD